MIDQKTERETDEQSENEQSKNKQSEIVKHSHVEGDRHSNAGPTTNG